MPKPMRSTLRRSDSPAGEQLAYHLHGQYLRLATREGVGRYIPFRHLSGADVEHIGCYVKPIPASFNEVREHDVGAELPACCEYFLALRCLVEVLL
jgi:hypothetical protein